MMLSMRYALPVAVLLAIAAVPTVIHSYMDSSRVDGRMTRDIPLRLADDIGAATSRRAGWGADRLASNDWIERAYGRTMPVRLFVGRSFDLKKLYHHPELAIDYGQSYGSHEVITLPQRPGMPVHVLRGGQSNASRLAMYVLEYDGHYVADPIWFQLRTSLKLLVSRRDAMTLFFAVQDLPGETTTPEGSRAATILVSAIDAFEAQVRR